MSLSPCSRGVNDGAKTALPCSCSRGVNDGAHTVPPALEVSSTVHILLFPAPALEVSTTVNVCSWAPSPAIGRAVPALLVAVILEVLRSCGNTVLTVLLEIHH